MLFNSFAYLLFFPVVALVYYLIPWQKVRNIFLLLASYYFYMSWDPRFILLMLGCTVITYLDALFIDISRKEDQENVAQEQRRTGKATLYTTVTIIFTLSVVAWFKYANFLTESIVAVLSAAGISVVIPKVNVSLPVGISFFTFQSLSYVIDVYRGKVKAEKNFFQYALFVSFFPQLVAGPIERSGNLLVQFKEKHRFDADRAVKGLLLMLWGYFMKIVIADRVAIIVDQVYNYYGSYQGAIPIFATILFAVQIYCDFNGYTTIAIGSAQVLGFSLMQNFRQPYLSLSVAEFWRNWHISLTSWFRDYIYIPLGGNRVSEVRWALNVMIVFLISGLWHGASWTFILWGGIHGLCQIIGKYKNKITDKYFMDRGGLVPSSVRCANVLVTFFIVNFLWSLFRANSIQDWLKIFSKLFVPMKNFDAFKLGMQKEDFILSIVLIVLLMILEYLHTRTDLYMFIQKQALPVRWAVYMAGIFIVILFGVYGTLSANSFIYFQF